VIGSDEFFMVAFVPACMSKSQASFEDLTHRGNFYRKSSRISKAAEANKRQHLTINRPASQACRLFCFARNPKHDSVHGSLKSPAYSPVSCSCTMKSRLTFSAKSRRSSLRKKWKYADSDAALTALSYQPLARPPTKTGFQSRCCACFPRTRNRRRAAYPRDRPRLSDHRGLKM